MPRSSTDTLRSLDFSKPSNILLTMDTEDSPWGGSSPSHSLSICHTNTAPVQTCLHALVPNPIWQTAQQALVKVPSDSSTAASSLSYFQDSQAASTQSQTASVSAASSPRTTTSRGPRATKRFAVPTTRLEPVDGSLDPLGPLGTSGPVAESEPEQRPIPPSKEQSTTNRNARQPASQSQASLDASEAGEDGRTVVNSRQRYHNQSQAHPENARRQAQPSVSIEQAARPTFDITVGDPHKVGDLTSSHIEYQVRTKVQDFSHADQNDRLLIV